MVRASTAKTASVHTLPGIVKAAKAALKTQDKIEGKADKLESKADKIEQKEDKLSTKLHKLENKADKIEKKLDKMELKFDKLEKKFDEPDDDGADDGRDIAAQSGGWR